MALMSRREAWRMFQRAITARARVLFSLLLSERRFRGKLVVDHKGKTLDLNVSSMICNWMNVHSKLPLRSSLTKRG